jgi:GT2 family glycosyltransferase
MLQLVVSIVTYNSDIKQLAAAIDSLHKQCDAMQIYLVDNASSAEYRANLEQFSDRVTIIDAPRNGGFGYGHNLAMLQSEQAEYFLCLNPDVILLEGAAQILMDFLTHHPQAGLVVPKVFYPDGVLQPLNKRAPNVLDLGLRLLCPPALTKLSYIKKRLAHYSMLDKGYDTAYMLPFASGCCMMFRRSHLLRLGGFDEGFFLYFEDADITMRMNEIAESWFCPDAHITHAWQRGSRSSLKLMGIMLHSAARYFAKWGLKLW